MIHKLKNQTWRKVGLIINKLKMKSEKLKVKFN
jgi:hypothetical protein